MGEAPLLEGDEYTQFYEIDESVIQFEGEVNEIQQVQLSMMEIAEEQAKDKVWSEMISWVEHGGVPDKMETRGKEREVLVARSMFDPTMFKMKDGVLRFTKAADKNRIGEVWPICLPYSIVTKV